MRSSLIFVTGMSSLELKVYELFKKRFSEEEAETVIQYFESKTENKFQEKKDILATKEDLVNAKVDLIKWFVSLFVGLALMIIGLYFKK